MCYKEGWFSSRTIFNYLCIALFPMSVDFIFYDLLQLLILNEQFSQTVPKIFH